MATSASGRRYFCGELVLIVRKICNLLNDEFWFDLFLQTYLQARDYCCQLGMRLAEFPSQEEYASIHSICGKGAAVSKN